MKENKTLLIPDSFEESTDISCLDSSEITVQFVKRAMMIKIESTSGAVYSLTNISFDKIWQVRKLAHALSGMAQVAEDYFRENP